MAPLLVVAVALVLAGLPGLEAAIPASPTCHKVTLDATAGTLNLEIAPPAGVSPAILGYTAKAINGDATIVPAPLLWSSAPGRVTVAFPASSFANQPDSTYTFTAAAINADGTSAECNPGARFSIIRPAAPGLLNASTTCDTVNVEFTRPAGRVVITGYVLTLGGKIKLEPFANVVVNGKKFLRFPASAFTAGNQQLTLAAKNIYGEGQASAPFIYTHVPCDSKVFMLEEALRGAESRADSAVRDKNAAAAELQTAKRDLASAVTANNTCANELSQLRPSLATCEASGRTLADANTALTGKLTVCEASGRTLADANTALTGKLTVCEASGRTLADANTALTAGLDTCKTSLKEAGGQLAERTRERDTCTTAKDGLQASLTQCNTDKATAATQCDSDKSSLKTSLDSCNTRRATCSSQLATLRSECSMTDVSTLPASPTCTFLGTLKTQVASNEPAVGTLTVNGQNNFRVFFKEKAHQGDPPPGGAILGTFIASKSGVSTHVYEGGDTNGCVGPRSAIVSYTCDSNLNADVIVRTVENPTCTYLIYVKAKWACVS